MSNNWNTESGTKSQFSERFYKLLRKAYEREGNISKAVDETMNLFTEEDKDFSERVKESEWSPTPPVVEQFREDFKDGCPTTKQLEGHGDWEISSRLPTGVTKVDGTHIDDAELLEVEYCGDKDFNQSVISKFLSREYQ